MPVYYHKTKQRYFIRITIGKKQYYCYGPLGTDEKFMRKKDAQQYEPTFAASLQTPRKTDEVTCDALYPLFMEELKLRLKPSTYYDYHLTMENYIVKLFKGIPISKVDVAFLENVNRTLNGRKHNITNCIYACKAYVKFLRKSNPSIDPDCIFEKKNFIPKEKKYDIYTADDFAKFLAVIKDEQDRFLFSLLFYYGLRIGECLGLKWEDFDRDKLHIKRNMLNKSLEVGQMFTTPKTNNSIRDYPIIDALRPYIERMKYEEHAKGFVFPTNKPRPGSYVQGQTTVRRKCNEYASAAGLEPIKLHEFRHSCVSNLLGNGMSYRTVARWVGDTEAMVLSTYSHLLPDEKTAISDFFNKSPSLISVPAA